MSVVVAAWAMWPAYVGYVVAALLLAAAVAVGVRR